MHLENRNMFGFFADSLAILEPTRNFNALPSALPGMAHIVNVNKTKVAF